MSDVGDLIARLEGARRWGRRRAARRLAVIRTPEAVRALAVALAAGRDERTAAIATGALTGLDDPACVDAVCEVMIADGGDRLADLVRAAGYRHSSPADQALLLFLAGDFEEYAELDFDGSMLAAAHVAADEGLRARLADRARESARMEWVAAIVSARGPERLMSRREWEAAVETLTVREQWARLWRLAQDAPAPWAARMLRVLSEREWRPRDHAERAAFEELAALATDCRGEPGEGLADAPTMLARYKGPLNWLAVTPDGASLIGARYQTGVQVWDLPAGDNARVLSGSWGSEFMLFPSGNLLAARGMDKVHLWRLPSGEPVASLEIPVQGDTMGTGSNETYHGMSATPNGELIVRVDGEMLYVFRSPWDGARQIRLSGRTAYMAAEIIAVAGHVVDFDRIVRAYDLATGAETAARSGDTRRMRCVVATPDGTLAAIAFQDGTVRLWRLPSLEDAGVLSGHQGRVQDLAVTPDGTMLASAGKDATVRLWRLPSGDPLGVLNEHGTRVTSLAVAPDGSMLAGRGRNGTVRLWRLPSGEPLGVLNEHGTRVTSFAVTPDSGVLAGGDRRGGMRLWRLWHPDLTAACGVPAARLDPSAAERLEAACADRAPEERDWARLIAALARWRHRHDVEVGDADAEPAAPTDIEIDHEGDRAHGH
ncbi:WD40 repeat domain-containing protein [Actinomadura sp. 9N215]|uniref:WD40 repeat domain-containing protein n=1 Tax=Actinomadura sp. 9N215 TaxID=3375150 RepID=UPI0037A91E48